MPAIRPMQPDFGADSFGGLGHFLTGLLRLFMGDDGTGRTTMPIGRQLIEDGNQGFGNQVGPGVTGNNTRGFTNPGGPVPLGGMQPGSMNTLPEFLRMLLQSWTPTNPQADKANVPQQTLAALSGPQGAPFGMTQGGLGSQIGPLRPESSQGWAQSAGSFAPSGFFSHLLNSVMPQTMTSRA